MNNKIIILNQFLKWFLKQNIQISKPIYKKKIILC